MTGTKEEIPFNTMFKYRKFKTQYMKQVKLIIALFTVTALIYSCNPKTKPGTTPVEPPKVEVGKIPLTEILSANEIELLTQTMGAAAKGKPVKLSQNVTVSASTMNLTNNGGGSFTIDYGGAANVVSMFFRGGDSLGASGNVYPLQVLQYPVAATTFNSTFTRTYYQSLVVTGSLERDVNGVLGVDWVFTYTTVVQ